MSSHSRVSVRLFRHLARLCGLLTVCAWSMTAGAGYAGPAHVAKADISLWPQAISSTDGFDRASRAYLLTYSISLADGSKLDAQAMLERFHIHSVNESSVTQWLMAEKDHVLRNYISASKNCTSDDWTCIGRVSDFEQLLGKAQKWKTSIPSEMQAWLDNTDAFSHVYTDEQMRLAALFPKVTSEISLFNSNEWNGNALPDRQFYLSFDDGPTAIDGNTEQTLAMLRDNNKSAVFFLLGVNAEKRIGQGSTKALSDLYSGQCVASHGWEHKSHAKWSMWQDSILRTTSLLENTLAQDEVLPLFRPPYGQRKSDSNDFFQSKHLHVALWDIDSQDWSKKISPDEVVDRILTLMLIKRHGVLLFHDIHPKSKVALPRIFNEDWQCREFW